MTNKQLADKILALCYELQKMRKVRKKKGYKAKVNYNGFIRA